MSRVPFPLRRGSGAVLVLIGALAAGAACGTPPEVREGTGGRLPRPTPSTGAPTSTSTPTPTPTPTPALPPPPAPPTTPSGKSTPTFDEAFTVDCAGYPSGTQVVRVLRRQGLIASGARVTVRTGPLCAGTWQYTVVTVPGREPLAVVTRGRPGDLTLVTAGTDVCSIPVRIEAPPGIRTAAACA